MKIPTAPPVQNPAQLTPAEGQAQPPQTSTRVLLVEDNKEHQRLLQFMLSRLGVHAVLAENGQQGFEAILGGDPAPLILMDLHMPRFDGYGATEQIREVERKNGQPRRTIIAVTAYTDPADREHCLAVGMDDVLLKPVSLDSLKTVLAKWMPKENLTD